MPTHRLYAIVLLIGFGLSARGWAATQAARDVAVRVHSDVILAHVPDDFLGFGYETAAVAQAGFFSPANAQMVRLYRNLGPHGLIRIGGNVSDHTRYEPDGVAVARTERDITVINRASLEALGEFARATGWKVMWGLNLKTGTPRQTADEADAVAAALGPQLQSFEIGNEVDLMPRYSHGYAAYQADYARFKSAIRARLPRAAFSGPDSAGNWSFVEQFVAGEAADMSLVTHHYYRGGAGDPRSTLSLLLARDVRFDERLAKLQSLSAGHGLRYRINEVNSFFGGGKAGVSDTFGSALWCLDFMFDVAAHCGAGVNMETDVNQLGFISHYSPIVHDAAGACSPRPEYYAMLAFAMAGRGTMLKTSVQAGGMNLTAYATRHKTGEIWVTVINKDAIADANAGISLPPGIENAAAYRLNAPAIDAKSGVSLGGAAVAADGTWPRPAAGAVEIRGGAARISVPHASAVIVELRASRPANE